jgi:hypothetical protein
MAHASSLSPSSQDGPARRGGRRAVIRLAGVLIVLIGVGVAGWSVLGPGADADTGAEPISFRDITGDSAQPDPDRSRYEHLAAGTEILAPGETHTFTNGVELTVSDPRVFTPETPEVLEALEGTALRISIRQEDFSGQDLPLAPAAPEVAVGPGLEMISRIWDTADDQAPALTATEGGAAFDVPDGTEFLIVEIRTPHVQSGLEYAHWRIDL